MSNKASDPRKLVGRETEQELFESLLKLQDEARILSIRDRAGTGKSFLLRNLESRCQTARPRVPICLIALDELAPLSPIEFVKKIVRELENRFKLKFPRFSKHSHSLISGDFSSILASISLDSANFEGASNVRMSTFMANADNATKLADNVFNLFVQSHQQVKLSYEQEKTVQDVCVKAFLDDLELCCAEQPIVIMIDVSEILYNKHRENSEHLREWIENEFLERCFFDYHRRPKQLLLVIAGQEVPEFHYHWHSEDCKSIVRSVHALSHWERHHVEEYFKIHDYNYKKGDIDFIYRCVKMGRTPLDITLAIQFLINGSNN